MKALGAYLILSHSLNKEEKDDATGIVWEQEGQSGEKVGTVVSIGSDAKERFVDEIGDQLINEGDIVYFTAYDAVVGEGEGKTKLIAVHAKNVIAVK